MAKEKKVARKNANAHANCRRKPCPYCAALQKADQEFTNPPDSLDERREAGRTGTYAG